MSTLVHDLLRQFERLSDEEKRQLAGEVIRWWARTDSPTLSDEEFVASAETILGALDAEEDGGKP